MKLTLLVLRMVPPIKLGLFVVGGERYLVSFAFCEALGKKKKKGSVVGQQQDGAGRAVDSQAVDEVDDEADVDSRCR